MIDPQQLDKVDLLTRTVYGEARGESEEGQAAVAWVIRNRAAAGRDYMGKTIKEVCLKPQQFSCWDSQDPNRNVLLTLDTNDSLYKKIRKVVEQVLNGTRPDNTYGSLHYHANYIKPSWTNGKTPVVTIGNHLFYNNIN
jgi:spore germination cell wall hydrolase CwlJ-like protein